MTQSELDAMKAAFLAKSAVTVAPMGVAYGVDKDTDRATRAEARREQDYSRIEHAAENAFQRGVEENGYYKS